MLCKYQLLVSLNLPVYLLYDFTTKGQAKHNTSLGLRQDFIKFLLALHNVPMRCAYPHEAQGTKTNQSAVPPPSAGSHGTRSPASAPVPRGYQSALPQ